jgi:hypothetical protein
MYRSTTSGVIVRGRPVDANDRLMLSSGRLNGRRGTRRRQSITLVTDEMTDELARIATWYYRYGFGQRAVDDSI